MNKPLSDQALDEPLPELTEQALQWLVDLHGGEERCAQWDDYLRWCDTSPEHQRASRNAERLWESLGSDMARPHAKRRLPVLSLTLALLLGGGLYWQGQTHGWMADHRTGMGERIELQLADGSRLQLAPRTRLGVRIDHGRRTLRLYSGEVYVQVAGDPQRPFEVQAQGGHIRALGTAFDVRSIDDAVQVVVTEHSVRVNLDDENQVAEVGEGQALRYSRRWLSTPITVDAEAATAWSRGRLVFDQQPLGEVIDALAPYHSGLLLLRDDALRQWPVTGVVNTHDTAAQLQLLQRSLPIRVRQLPWITLIERDPARAGPSKK